MITLNAELRDVKVNPKMIRREGKIPAVYYGNGKESTAISVDAPVFKKAYDEAGESTIISLKTPEGVLDALIHDVALDSVIGNPIHIDFYIVSKDQKLQVDVPIEFIGTAPVEKMGGIVMKVMHELRIEALPAKLPSHITVDLTKLVDMDSSITVADLDLGEGVRALVPLTETVAGVTEAKEEEEVVAAPIDLSAIEVEKKGKKEEGGEAGGDAEKVSPTTEKKGKGD
ncbi:MAG TPA: 50S ribosomal protein L25 [Candidatus Paceibacterota bacterium]